jgi:hypothetical protein
MVAGGDLDGYRRRAWWPEAIWTDTADDSELMGSIDLLGCEAGRCVAMATSRTREAYGPFA